MKQDKITPNTKQESPEKVVSISQNSQPTLTDQKNSAFNSIISSFLICSIFLIGAYFYFDNQNRNLNIAIKDLNKDIQKQQGQINESESQGDKKIMKLESQIMQKNDEITKINLLIQDNQNNMQNQFELIESLQYALAEVNMQSPLSWQLSEIKYLLNLANNKLILEQDLDTSLELILNARDKVTATNNPNLLGLRRSIESDIIKLNSIAKIDLTPIIISLTSLREEIPSSLDFNVTDLIEENQVKVSNDISDWQENIKVSWQGLLDSFITLKRKDSEVKAILTPQINWYLIENIKSQLLQVENSIYRRDQANYVKGLENSIKWIEDYFSGRVSISSITDKLIELKDIDITKRYDYQLKSLININNILSERKDQFLSLQVNNEVDND